MASWWHPPTRQGTDSTPESYGDLPIPDRGDRAQEHLAIAKESDIRIALVVNPRALAGPHARAGRAALDALRRRASCAAELETRGDGADAGRVARLVREVAPDVVVAAGGDGTVSEVARGLVEDRAPPVLAILPLGTANNVARALGLPPPGGRDATVAVAAALAGRTRRLDLGWLDGRYFVGSAALGMDADILRTRNRLRRRLRLGRRLGGYPLYLWSCAFNLLASRHGARARLRVDGAELERDAYDLLVTNTPLYAGEFRFDAEGHDDDGCLDLHVIGGPLDYVRRFVAAWVRHLRWTRGRPVTAPSGLMRAREIAIALERPVALQVDGEEVGAVARCTVRVAPGALAVRVPAADRGRP
jgi:diacylglycerol kinase (ATP)